MLQLACAIILLRYFLDGFYLSDLNERIVNLSPEKLALLELQLIKKGLAEDKLESIPRINTL
jgi:hypothetical protein